MNFLSALGYQSHCERLSLALIFCLLFWGDGITPIVLVGFGKYRGLAIVFLLSIDTIESINSQAQLGCSTANPTITSTYTIVISYPIVSMALDICSIHTSSIFQPPNTIANLSPPIPVKSTVFLQTTNQFKHTQSNSTCLLLPEPISWPSHPIRLHHHWKIPARQWPQLSHQPLGFHHPPIQSHPFHSPTFLEKSHVGDHLLRPSTRKSYRCLCRRVLRGTKSIHDGIRRRGIYQSRWSHQGIHL